MEKITAQSGGTDTGASKLDAPYVYEPFASIKPRSDTLRAAVYARVSKPEQAHGKVSIPDQLQVSRRAISEHSWEFFAEFTDAGVSGALIEERPAFRAVLQAAREHRFDLLVVKDYDRFARDKDSAAIIRKELKELGIQTFAVNTPVAPKPPSQYDPNDDDLAIIVESFSDMRSDLERKQILRRMKMGKLGKAESGIIPNKVPYGYRVSRTLEGTKIKRTILVDEDQAARVRFIFTSYAQGTGDRKIVIALNKKGWASPKGGQWNIASLKYILTNPTYTGRVWWGWRHAIYKKTKEWRRRGKRGYIGPGNHPSIIEEELFNLAQQIRSGRAKVIKGGSERSFGLLTGLAKCIRCGSGVGYQKRFHSRSKKNSRWRDTVTHEYICTGYKYKGICSPRVMSADKLEPMVLDQIRNVYSHPKVQERIVFSGESGMEDEKELMRVEQEIAMEQEKLDRQHDAYERGILTIEEYEANITRIREHTKRNRAAQSGLRSHSSLASQKAAAVQKLIASLKDFDIAWKAMQLDEQKLILRSIIKQIRAGNGKVEIDFLF